MTLQSMTGFGRADGATGALTWVWEARSVNGRGLDVRLRLPPGSDALEPRVRERCAKRFQRGNIQLNLTVKRASGSAQIRLNQAALAQVAEAVRQASALCDAEPARLDGLLAIKGVLETVEVEDSEEARAKEAALIEASLDVGLDALAAARSAEGRRLEAILRAQLTRVAELVAAAEASPARTPDAIRLRLAEQVGKLLNEASQLDPARLYAEAALIASKADIEEELKRLTSHVAAVHDLLVKGGAIGRQLEFLAQEFNREANTLCAKSADTEITRIGLGLKLVIDQMREQVQNIE